MYGNNNPLRFTDPDGMQARTTEQEMELVGRFLKGFFVGGPQSVVQAAVDQGLIMVCLPCHLYNKLEAELDGTAQAERMAQVEYVKSLANDEGALAEFGGMIGFNVVFARGVGLGAAFSGEAATQAPKPLGLGSTGRTVANTLEEQLAMRQAMSRPAEGTQIILKKGMTDTRWPASEGWVKMSQNVNGVEIHYVRNTKTGAVDDFKFKDK